ncbi:site-2 protease family protein [Aeromicrobium sp. UC242_57]|uniref:site-2 protease family protein n=1 Tax=Aeromicrobium sp. UC242_57 TaxID=3374624 RepID=UPI0037A1E361
MSDSHRPGAWRIGRLFGVDLLIRPSLLILGAILVVVFAPRYENWTDTNPYVLSTIFVVSLYVSILVHEIAHLVMARSYGMRVDSVTLHLLGGETLIAGQSRTPSQELLTSIVGPAASLAIALGAFGVSDALGTGTAADVVWSIAVVNLIVAIFNMIPGLPLDGGRVFRAVIWMVTRDEEVGIRAAGWVGRLTAVALVVAALVTFGDAEEGVLNLLVAAMVAVVLWQGASQALRSAARTARINQPLPASSRCPVRHHRQGPSPCPQICTAPSCCVP